MGGLYVCSGGRYTQDMYGLRIQNITIVDDGIYNCRAEVDSDGRYDERAISVVVYSKYDYFFSEVDFLMWHFHKHVGVATYGCGLCGIGFLTMQTLQGTRCTNLLHVVHVWWSVLDCSVPSGRLEAPAIHRGHSCLIIE